jgi:hypothetical protein
MAAMSDDDVKQRIEKEVTLEHSTQRAPEHALKNRLLFHVAHKVWSRAPLTSPPQRAFPPCFQLVTADIAPRCVAG